MSVGFVGGAMPSELRITDGGAIASGGLGAEIVRSKNAEMIEIEIQSLENKLHHVHHKYTRAIAALKSLIVTANLLTPETITRAIDEITRGLDGEGNVQWRSASDDIPIDEEFDENSSPQFTGTIAERMRAYFLSRNNLPATNAQIRKAIKSGRGTTAMVLYSTHANEYEKVKVEGTHLVHWRMADEAWKAIQPKEIEF